MKRYILLLLGLGTSIMLHAQSAYSLHYWYDGDYSTRDTVTFDSTILQFQIDVSELSEGFHSMSFQVQDTFGRWTAPRVSMFYRTPTSDSGQFSMTYTYWYDQDYTQHQTGVIGNGNLLLDVSQLDDGLHTISIQLGEGNMAQLQEYVFYKMPAIGLSDSNYSMTYAYWYDQDYSQRHTGAIGSGNLLFDVSQLNDGLHTISIQLGEGNMAQLQNYYFVKYHDYIIDSLRQINKYEFIINDNINQRYITDIPVTDTFQLITLLPVEPQPIRSSSFHYEPNGGAPVIYAQNDIRLRFWSEDRRYAEYSTQYVDYYVVDTVYADTLERDTTKVIAAPRNNEIHWFKLYAGVGDSLSFYTNRRCTMQLYTPSGEMIFHASGDSVLTWTGCHAWEDGVCYLAVHDAEGAGDVAVSYQWIYRYAVLSWDVHRVGNGGISTITFEGNGFDSLDTVYLIKGTDTLPALYIGREKNTETSVFFNFENVDTGVYNAVFEYVDETLNKSNVVTVETAVPIILTSTCSFPSTFLRGGTVTYRFEVSNTGNMTAYRVPLYFYMGSNTFDGISCIHVGGLPLKKLYEYVSYFDQFDYATKEEWIQYCEKMGDAHYFTPYYNENEDGNGDSIAIRIGYFYVDINPYETKHINLDIVATETIDIWLSIPDTMVSLQVYIVDSIRNAPSMFLNEKTHFCCWHDGFESALGGVSITAGSVALISMCIPELISKGAAAVAEIISLACGAASSISSAVASVVCENNSGIPTYKDKGNWFSLIGNLLNIVSRRYSYLDIPLSIIGLYLDAYGVSNSLASRDEAHKDPHCSPHPPKGGESTPQHPVDPNEIIGYLAESGSHAVGAEMEQLYYSIEFENDTTFATANAHTVQVIDTLDGNAFDLNSFAATSFSIGEQVVALNGERSFIRTVDMRPAINVLAQVQLEYDDTAGIARWTFRSLDPMTLQETTDPTLGFLPANYNGDGIGQVDFLINRKQTLRDSAIIDNRAYIVFDNEAPIATSTWRNIMDTTPPVSSIDSVVFTGGMATVNMRATDNLSGVWRYHVYAQENTMWQRVASDVPVDSVAMFVAETNTYTAFRTTAIDSAGNVEPLYSANDAAYSVPLAVEAGVWYAISSPTHNTANNNETVAGVANLVSDTVSYDLFYYDESNATWRNYKVHSFDLEAGVGYVYRRSAADTLRFTGEPNTDSIEVTLTAGGSNSDLRGFNLIGNPYPYEVGYGAPYYELRPNGTWYAHTSGVIDVAQGFLVHTTTPTSYTFVYPTPDNAKGAERMPLAFTVAGNGYEDVVYVLFDEGEGLPKMGHLSADAPALSIDGKAIAMLGRETEEFPLTLRATPGDYALTAHPAQLYYLHLIDKATGADRDLLADSSYTFRHRGYESDAERFVVRLAPAMHGTEGVTFAYTDGTSIVVRGEGLLQVFDMLGRLVMTCEVDSERHIPVTHFHTGVYALRLAGKSQKIVVR